MIECVIDRKKDKAMMIYGTKGKIEPEPFYRPTKAVFTSSNGESYTGEMSSIHDDFYGEIEATHRGMVYIKTESERMSHQDSLDCIKLIETVKEIIDKDNSL